jgi:DNA-binding NarL/FixJ family response regulator
MSPRAGVGGLQAFTATYFVPSVKYGFRDRKRSGNIPAQRRNRCGSRLIAALAEGVEAKSYAEQQGITMDAVKFHLKTAFAKTGLRSQARLLQAVARALADLSARRRGDE